MADLLAPRGAPSLRRLIDDAQRSGRPLVMPGCYDALGARLIEQAGFEAVYMTGFGSTAGLLGRPDVGLLGLTEMVDNARRIVLATSLPVLADADTGYGNAINVLRTVQEFERAGVRGIHLEDQVMPKKCGHMNDKAVVSRAEMVAKIEAAVAARHDPDFVIIARTDSRAPHGLDDAIGRGHAFAAAGADVLFIEALQGRNEIEQIAAEFAGVPLLFNWVEGGKTPPLTYAEIAELGYAAVILPVGLLFAATAAMQRYLQQVRAAGTPADFDPALDFDAFTNLIGLPEITDLEQRFRG